MERFFIVLNKINSVILLLILLGGGIVFSVIALGEMRRSQNSKSDSGSVKMAADVQQNFRLQNDATVIRGANTQMIELLLDRADKASYSKANYNESRNALFLRGSDSRAYWLFKENTQLISNITQLALPDVNTGPTVALLIKTVPKDSNGDGLLSLADSLSVGISKPDGSGYVAVIQGADQILSSTVLDYEDTLSVIYQKGSQIRQARVSMKSFKLLLDQEISHLPKLLVN